MVDKSFALNISPRPTSLWNKLRHACIYFHFTVQGYGRAVSMPHFILTKHRGPNLTVGVRSLFINTSICHCLQLVLMSKRYRVSCKGPVSDEKHLSQRFIVYYKTLKITLDLQYVYGLVFMWCFLKEIIYYDLHVPQVNENILGGVG